MATLPEDVSKAWENKKGAIILTTVAADGTPNAIYASCVRRLGEDAIVVADNFFDKTRANLLAGSKGSILFITEDGKSFQVKGPVARQTEGEAFDFMKSWNGDRPGHAAAVLTVEEAYSGAKKLL